MTNDVGAKVMRRFTLRVTLESPFATRGLQATAFGIDCPLARNHEGRLILPGSLLLGVVREALETLNGDALETGGGPLKLKTLFGVGSGDIDDDEDGRGFERQGRLVQIFDLGLVGDEPNEEDRSPSLTRIEIDPATGAVREGALQVVECPFPVGSWVAFEGEMTLTLPFDQIEDVAAAVRFGLEATPALGGLKSVGFGRIREVEIEPKPEAAAPDGMGDIPADATVVALALRFLDPFLVSTRRLAGNVFEGDEVVPGSVIKGALARRLEATGVLGDPEVGSAFSRMIVAHAFPVCVGRETYKSGPVRLSPETLARPARVALSTLAVRLGENRVRLFDDLDGDGHEAAKDLGQSAFDLEADWKEPVRDVAKHAYGWTAKCDRFARVRTKIARESGTADESKLFAQRLVAPTDHFWRFRLIWPEPGAAPPAFCRLVAELVGRLDGIGKTDARAEVTLLGTEALPGVTPRPDGAFRVVLQSPANLHKRAGLVAAAELGNGFDLADSYAAYWDRALRLALAHLGADPDEPLLVSEQLRFMAEQEWAGGWPALRFAKGDPYFPVLLTKAGSAFLLTPTTGQGEAVQRALEVLSRHNLPLPDAGRLDDPKAYARSVFAPQGGFGEIFVGPPPDEAREGQAGPGRE